MEKDSSEIRRATVIEDRFDFGDLLVNTFGLIVGFTIAFLPVELKSNFFFTFAIFLNFVLYGFSAFLHRSLISVFLFYFSTSLIWLLNLGLQLYRIFS